MGSRSFDPVTMTIWQKFHVKHGDVLPYKGWQGTRETLAELFAELGYKCGAEIGVQHGKFSEILCKANPGLKLKCIEPWKAFSHHTDEEMEGIYQHALKRLEPYGVEFIRKTSLDGAKDVADGFLDFVYIDGLHDFDTVIQDIIAWFPKVRSGGIVSGHDYYRFYGYGVIPAVDTFSRVHNITMYYMTRENESPSWFFVKP